MDVESGKRAEVARVTLQARDCESLISLNKSASLSCDPVGGLLRRVER
jgi:hypothetical protein